jgi:hypothetical protein
MEFRHEARAGAVTVTCPHLLVAMGPDRRHPVKARAVRAPGSAGCGLDRLAAARQGLAMQIRQKRLAACKSISTLQVDDSDF